MTAIITDNFRISAARFLKEKIQLASTAPYYMFLGRSQPWPNEQPLLSSGEDPTTVPQTEDNHQVTHYDAFQNMHVVKKINAHQVELCTKRVIWVSDTVYRPWDSNYTDGTYLPNSFVSGLEDRVVTDRHVFLCLSSPAYFDVTSGFSYEPSTIRPTKPDSIGTSTPRSIFKTSDGYVWMYLYTIDDQLNSSFTTGSYMPVPFPTTGGDSRDADQIKVQDNAPLGKIYSIHITDGGYYNDNTKPTVTLIGDGSLVGGNVIPSDQITMKSYTNGTDTWWYICDIQVHADNVSLDDLNGVTSTPEDDAWTQVEVVITGGNYYPGQTNPEPSAVAVLPPQGGFGKCAQIDLAAHNLGLNCEFNFESLSGFKTASQFREIGVVTGLTEFDTDGTTVIPYVGDFTNTLKKLTMASETEAEAFRTTTSTFTNSAGATAHLDLVKDDLIYYHQDDTTGFKEFSASDNITSIEDSSVTGTVAANGILDADIIQYTGDIIYLEKRHKVLRAEDQIENIKLVVEL